MAKLFAVMAQAMAAEGPAEARRAAIGRFALDADALPEERFVASFRYLNGEPWPTRFTCPSGGAIIGQLVVSGGRTLGAWGIGSAVALSAVVPPPVRPAPA